MHFNSQRLFDKHNNAKHPELLFDPMSMITLPPTGWVIFPDNNNTNIWHVERLINNDAIVLPATAIDNDEKKPFLPMDDLSKVIKNIKEEKEDSEEDEAKIRKYKVICHIFFN
jgi:hypothetical protein